MGRSGIVLGVTIAVLVVGATLLKSTPVVLKNSLIYLNAWGNRILPVDTAIIVAFIASLILANAVGVATIFANKGDKSFVSIAGPTILTAPRASADNITNSAAEPISFLPPVISATACLINGNRLR